MKKILIVPEGVDIEWNPQECDYCGQPWHDDGNGLCSSCSARPQGKPIIARISKEMTGDEIDSLSKTLQKLARCR